MDSTSKSKAIISPMTSNNSFVRLYMEHVYRVTISNNSFEILNFVQSPPPQMIAR